MSAIAEHDYAEEAIRVIQELEAQRTYGRPSVMTPAKIRKFLEALERGNFPEPASHYAGLSYRTVRRWLEEGEQDETESTPQFHFRQATKTAEAIWESAMVGVVTDAAKSNPRFYMASIIGLSRRQRERWAERTADELRAAQTPSVQVLIGIAPPGTPQNQIVTVKQRAFASESLEAEAKQLESRPETISVA